MKSAMQLLVIFNPRAAHGRAGRWLPRIRKRLREAGIEVTVAETRAPGHAETLARDADAERYTALAVAGGDGTLFETINGLMAREANARLPLGLIPMGTGNAFSRDIGLGPGQWRDGLELLIGGHTRRVDVGLVECDSDRFHFLNIAGLGFVTDAGRTAARLKFLGRAAYTLATLARCVRLRSHDLRIELDGREIREEGLFLVASNSRYTGTTFCIAPGARIDDGELDIVLVRKLPRRRLLRLFPTIYSGRHIEYEEVDVIRAREVTIREPSGLELMVDGEFRGTTPARISCLPGAIEMFSAAPGAP